MSHNMPLLASVLVEDVEDVEDDADDDEPAAEVELPAAGPVEEEPAAAVSDSASTVVTAG